MEKTVEGRLRALVKRKGGLCLKWSSPGFTGVPDRIVMMPGGRIWFVELKNGKDGELSARQEVVHEQFLFLGFQTFVIRDHTDVLTFVAGL